MTDMNSQIEGWMFTDENSMEWQVVGDGVAMKTLGVADGRMLALFRFDAGYVGGTHHHEDPEFTYVLNGSLVSNGVTMEAGQAYAAQAGTDHTEFRSETGATLVSVFKMP